MGLLRAIGLCSAILILPQASMASMLGYYFKGAVENISLFFARESIDKVLVQDKLPDADKKKLKMAMAAKKFAEDNLGLKKSKNYSKFVQLDRPHLVYVVNASPKWELKHYLFKYIVLGELPYKGFFNEAEAKQEKLELEKQDLDVYVRGASAYSSLGYISDPIYSSMLRGSEADLVNTIIHETVHATLYIKSSADFNERLATFIGNKGSELFYEQLEGPNSPTLAATKIENQDEKLFSEFISKEIKALEEYYKTLPESERSESKRVERLQLILDNFDRDLKPKLNSSLSNFSKVPMSNARLLLFKTYNEDLSDFALLFEKSNSDFKVFMQHCKSLEDSPSPEIALKDLLKKLDAQ